jgi:tRNA pseudouridine38-40 synthase
MTRMTEQPSNDPDLVRLRLDVAYDGTEFSGWATQPDRRTVQGTIQTAIATVLRLPEVRLTVAGRTDAGVHARGQVCHVDLSRSVIASSDGVVGLHRRLSRLLPADVRVRGVQVAPDGFDARFSAVWRRYVYRLCDESSQLDPLRRNEILVWPRHLDESVMNAAAQGLLGEHDFATFCKRREGATTIRTLQRLSWRRDGALVSGTVVADAFCHSMVRALVGALVAVGEGRQPTTWPAEALATRTREASSTVVPAHGLTLEEVGYPADVDLAARAVQARAVRAAGGDTA